jgi:hypothetical protein
MAQEIARPAATAMMSPIDKNVYEQYADAVNQQRIIGDLLKFSKGEWLTGREAEEIAEGTELIAGCDQLLIGWIKWADFKPVEYQMGRLAEGFLPAKRSDLDDQDQINWPRDESTGLPRDPWQLSNSMVLMDPGTRQLYTFAAASKGAIGAMGKLMGSYGKHVRQAPADLPVVALLSDSYKHSNKAYGKIHFPVLKVTGWANRMEFDSVLAGALDEVVDESDPPHEEAVHEPPVKKGGPPADYAAAKGKRKRRAADDAAPF